MRIETETAVRSIVGFDSEVTKEMVERAIDILRGKTDADGVAEFDEAPGSYSGHLLKVPEGFAKDSTEYEAPSVPGDLTIVVKAA